MMVSMATAWPRPVCSPRSPNLSAPMVKTQWQNSWKAFPSAFVTASFRPCWRSSKSLRLQRLQKPHWLARRRRGQFTLPHHPAAAHEGADRPTGDAQAVIGRPAGTGSHPFIGDGLAAFEIDDGEIRIVARRDPPLACDVEKPRRPGAGQ